MLFAQFIRNAKVCNTCFIVTIKPQQSKLCSNKANTAANFSARNKLAINLFSIK